GQQGLLFVDAQDRPMRHHAVQTVVGGAGRGDDHLALAFAQAGFPAGGLRHHERIVVGEKGTPLGRPAGEGQKHVGHEAGLFLDFQDPGADVLGQGVQLGQRVAVVGCAHRCLQKCRKGTSHSLSSQVEPAIFSSSTTGVRSMNARRNFMAQAIRYAAAASLGCALTVGHAQSPTKVLVGFPPGGGTDAIARIIAEQLQVELGSSVVVDNKPGAGGQLAAQALKAAAPDGRTLFLSHDHSVSILPLTMKNPGFDPAKDFAPVAGFATFVNAVALSGGTPARDFKAWIDSVKAAGGKATMGIPAPASTPQFAVQVIGKQYGLDLVAAPYRGSAPMMADMLGNTIPAGVGSVPDFIENHKAGKLRVAAVMGTQRQAALPEVPTFTELGLKGFEEVPYYGLRSEERRVGKV